MPDEKDIQLNLTGSIKDLANMQRFNTTTTNEFRTNTVVSNLNTSTINKNTTSNQPFTATQFAKLMDALATMTNRLETAHRRTHDILEKMQLSLATRLESIHKQMVIMNKTSFELNKKQLELQKAAETNAKDLTFKLSGIFGSEDFRKSLLSMQKYISSRDIEEQARVSLIRLLGSVKILRGFIGYEVEEFKGKMKPMPFTLELYNIVSNVPKYFDTLAKNIYDLEKEQQKGILQARHSEILDMFSISNNLLKTMVDIQYHYTHDMFPSLLTNLSKDTYKKLIKESYKNSLEIEKNYERLHKNTTRTQIEELQKLRVTFTTKVDDLLKQSISVGQGLFNITKYLMSPASLFGKLFWGFISYRGLAGVLMSVFKQVFAVSSPVVNAIKTAFSEITRGVLGVFGITVKEGESPVTVLKDTFLSALKTFWFDYAWPTLEKGIGTLVTLYGISNIVRTGILQRGLLGEGPIKKLEKKYSTILEFSAEKTGAVASKLRINSIPIVSSLASKLLVLTGRILESSNLFGLDAAGVFTTGIGKGLYSEKEVQKTKEKIKNMSSSLMSRIVDNVQSGISDISKKPQGGTLIKILGKIIPIGKKFLSFIPMIGPIAIGLSILAPLVSSGMTFLKETLLPKVFGKGNVPSDLRSIVSGLLKKGVIFVVDTIINIIKNIPKAILKTGNIIWQISMGIVDAVKDMLFGLIKSIFRAGKRILGIEDKTAVTNIQNKNILEEKREAEKNSETNKEMVNEIKAQTSSLENLLDYFRGGKFKDDVSKIAEATGKSLRTLLEVMTSIKDFVVGKLGGFLSSLGATLGGFMVGLVGKERSLSFLSKAEEIARARGYTGVARMISNSKTSVLGMMDNSVDRFGQYVNQFGQSVADLSKGDKPIIITSEERISAIKPTGRGMAAVLSSKPVYSATKTSAAISLMTGSTVITSRYGEIRSGGRIHKGIDIDLAKGDPVAALYSGIVSKVGYDRRGYGKYVQIDHPDLGVRTLYAHLDDNTIVKVGQTVAPGTIIGIGGNTGRVWSAAGGDGSHLHFEVRDLKTGEPRDPISFINSTINGNHPLVLDYDKISKVIKQRAEKTGAFAVLKTSNGYKASISTLHELQAKEKAKELEIIKEKAIVGGAGRGSVEFNESIRPQPYIENLYLYNTVGQSNTSNQINANTVNNAQQERESVEKLLSQMNRSRFFGGPIPEYDIGTN